MIRKTTRDIPKRNATGGSAAEDASVEQVHRVEIHLKILKWVFFEVGFVLLPLACNWASGMIRAAGITAEQVLGRGELLLVSVAITAAAVGDLFKGGLGKRLRRTKLSLVGFGTSLMIGSTWLYATAATAVTQESDIRVPTVIWISVFVAVSSILTSVGCLIAAEVK